jgi:protocatechuate 3,4-dioxygenase beta subunit
VGFYDQIGTSFGYATTDGNGAYQSPALPAGQYVVEALPFGDPTYHATWYDGTSDVSSATPVTVTVGSDHGDVDFSLASQQTISGTVTDAQTGEPIASATVYTYGANGAYLYASTDSYGNYSLAAGDGVFTVYVSAFTYADGAARQITVDGEPVTDVDFSLGGATVRGTVTGADTGEPLPNICVDASFAAQTCTAWDGVYVLHVPAGTYTVDAYPPSWIGSPYLGASDDNGGSGYQVAQGDDLTVDFALDRGAVISGAVTDASTGAPLGNICVEILSVDGAGSYGTTCTDSAGTYRSVGLPAGDYSVAFTNNGGRYVTEWYDDSFDADGATTVTVATGTDIPNIDASLTLGGSLHGTLTRDDTDDPVPGCIDVESTDGSNVIASGCAGADGHYTVNGIRPGDWLVRFGAPGLRTEYWHDATSVDDATSVHVVSGGDEDLDVALGLPMGGIAGSATDAADASVEGVCAYLYDQYQGMYLGFAYCTGTDGQFGFIGLTPGTYWVAVADPSGRYRTAWQQIDVVDGDPTPLTVQLAADGSVSGVIRDPSSQAVDDVCAYLYDATSTTYQGVGACTGADGLYLLDVSALPEGDYVVRTYDPRARWNGATSEVVHAGGIAVATADVTVSPAASLAGRVTDAVTGDGVGNACLYLYTSADEPAGFATCTRPDGYYALSGVPAGDYKVGAADTTASHTTYWSGGAGDLASAATVSITADGVTSFNAPLAPIAGVALHVQATDGSPIDGVCLYLVHLDGSYAGYASCSGADGTVSLFAPASTYDLVVSDPQGRFVTTWSGGVETADQATPVAIGPGVTDVGTLTMRGVGSITGTVVDADGNPVAGVAVYLDRADGAYAQLSGVTGADGSCSILGVPEGEYRAGFYPPGMGSPTTIWYSGKNSEVDADLIAVERGVTTTGVDATVPTSG